MNELDKCMENVAATHQVMKTSLVFLVWHVLSDKMSDMTFWIDVKNSLSFLNQHDPLSVINVVLLITVQYYSISNADALKILQSCAKPVICVIFFRQSIKKCYRKTINWCCGLTHCGLMMASGILFNICSGNGLSPVRHPGFTWTSVDLLPFRHKFQWNMNKNSNLFIRENVRNVFKMAAILFRPQCVKSRSSCEKSFHSSTNVWTSLH